MLQCWCVCRLSLQTVGGVTRGVTCTSTRRTRHAREMSGDEGGVRFISGGESVEYEDRTCCNQDSRDETKYNEEMETQRGRRRGEGQLHSHIIASFPPPPHRLITGWMFGSREALWLQESAALWRFLASFSS